jgi:3-oxoacyl-[acyl-carrier protein] reductase
MALRFLAEECSVIICGRNTEKLENAVEYLRTKVAGAKVEYLQMDQLDNESIGRAVALLQKRSSFVDILINNAGICTDIDKKKRFRNVTKEQFETVWKTNYEGAVQLTELIAGEMKKRGIQGNIVNIASICAEFRSFRYMPYGMSKAAIIEYSKILNERYENIVVNVIETGLVATIMNNLNMGDNISKNMNVLKHPAMPEEIAALAAFLCSTCGKYLKDGITASACEVL